MAGYNFPYSRLVDAQHERKRSVAALRRSTTVFFVLCVIAVVLAVGIIATLAVYLYFSSQIPVTDGSLLSTEATRRFARTKTDSEDFASVLQRLNNLEEEVEKLKRRCGGSSLRRDKGHSGQGRPDKESHQPEAASKEQNIDQPTTQESVTSILQRLMSTKSSISSGYHLNSEQESLESSQSSNQESTILPHRSFSTSSPYITTVGPSPMSDGIASSVDQQTNLIKRASAISEGLAPSVDQQSNLILRDLFHDVGELHRVARSKHDRKSNRRSREDSALSTAEPSLRERGYRGDRGDRGDKKRDGQGNTGSRDRSSKQPCTPCTAPTTFGLAAHFEGQRDGNVLITDAGRIREPRIWGYAEWMTQKDKDKFQLGITQVVKVTEGGVYYIYSQIMFYDLNSAVGQSICVNDRPRFTCTKSNISAEAKQSTCFLGGVVRLEDNDVLSIQLSIPNVSIALYADTSFFGLFKLAPTP
ncbi:uncharacterized protein [Asterias amurensis]|uniref:uncharacterized protein isoform X2 n=1 Tax=Asterias amurensis TaxID=7602 RepID=UPI003AB39D1C